MILARELCQPCVGVGHRFIAQEVCEILVSACVVSCQRASPTALKLCKHNPAMGKRLRVSTTTHVARCNGTIGSCRTREPKTQTHRAAMNVNSLRSAWLATFSGDCPPKLRGSNTWQAVVCEHCRRRKLVCACGTS
jgi:hypothetical protein